MTTLLGPGTVITNDAAGLIIPDGGVVFDTSGVLAVGPFAELAAAHPEATVVDAGGRTVMPGLINAHAHFYGLFARGMSLKDPPPETFLQVLQRLWWRLDKALDARANFLSALLGGVAALRAGCTTVIDHHASPNAIPGSLDRVAEAVNLLGLRACLCYEVTDRDGPERAMIGILENVRFARSLKPGGRLAAKFGLHASLTVGPETLASARRAEADLGIGFHVHCDEGPEDGAHARHTYGMSTVERLKAEGVLGGRTLLAHCVHVDRPDMELLAETGTAVSHQPHSNMGNAVGWARMRQMERRGVPTALGTDGYTWDMIETMRTAAVLHSHEVGLPGTGVGEFASLLLRGNAELAGRIFGRKVGSLEPGAAADVILLDYWPPTPVTAGNLPWHIQFGLSTAQVHSVWVDGVARMTNRQIKGAPDFEAAFAREARELAPTIWERF